MFLKLHDILQQSSFFTNIPSKKDEKWRFSSLHNFLEKSYQTTSSHTDETFFTPTDRYWVYIKDGQLLKQVLPSTVHLRRHPIAYEVSNNPFACLASNKAPSPLELICYEDVEFGLYFENSKSSFINSHISIILKDHVSANIYMCYEGGEKSFISHASHIKLHPFSTLHLIQTQDLESDAVLITQNNHHLEEESCLKSFLLMRGGEYLHNFVHTDLHFKSEADISSLLISRRNEKHIFSCDIEHLADGTKSRVLSKQVAKEMSTCVFDANTIIHAKTKLCEARQASRALLLDDTAQIHSKPHLEIYSDDLKASHGSTIGQLDIEAIGYLVSRGISEEIAKKILITAFVNEPIEGIDEIHFKERVLKTLGEDDE